jgi:hypothetical protein
MRRELADDGDHQDLFFSGRIHFSSTHCNALKVNAENTMMEAMAAYICA